MLERDDEELLVIITPRNRALSKIDRANDSNEFNKKKLRNEQPSQLNQIIAQETKRQNSQRLTLQIRSPQVVQNDFRLRVITQYQQGVRDIQRSTAITKSTRQVSQEMMYFIPTEQQVRKQSTSAPLYRISKHGNGQNWLLSGRHSHVNNSLYMRAIHSHLYCEDQPALIASQEIRTYEALIQNIQIADKFMNDYGLFYVLKEGLQDLNVQFLMTGESQFSADAQTENYELTKGKQIVQMSGPQKSNLLSFRELVFFGSSYSLLKFQMQYQDTPQFNYQKLREDYSTLTRLQESISSLIVHHEIHWLRLAQLPNGHFMMEFTMPLFQDHQESTFIAQIATNQRLTNFTCCKSAPLLNPIELQLQNFDPWCNREFKTDSGSTWRMFAIKQIERPAEQSSGYVNLFYEDDQARQDLSQLGTDMQGVVICTNYQQFAQMEHEFAFLKCKWIEVMTYQESKQFKILLKVNFDRSRAVEVKTVKLESSVYVMPNWDHMTLTGILVQELLQELL